MVRIGKVRVLSKLQSADRRHVTIMWLIAVVVTAAGCQQQDSLHGTVTYNGEPIERGSILFMSADGNGSGFGAQVQNGNYTTDQMKLGKHIAIVRGLDKPAVISKDESIRQRQLKDNPHGLNVDYIPESAEGNSRTVDVEGGKQELNFALKGPPRSE